MPDPTVMSMAEHSSLDNADPVFVNHTDSDGKTALYTIHLPQELVWYWDRNPHPAITVDKERGRLRVDTVNCHAEYARAKSDANLWYLLKGGPDMDPAVVPLEVIKQAAVHRTVRSGAAVINASGAGSGYGYYQMMSGGGGAGGAGGHLHIQASYGTASGNLYGHPVYQVNSPPGGQLTASIFANAVQAVNAPRKFPQPDPNRKLILAQRRQALSGALDQRAKMALMRQWRAQDIIDSPEAERTWQVRVDAQVELIRRKLEAATPGENQRAFFRQLAILMDQLGTEFSYADEHGIQPSIKVDDMSALSGTGENPNSTLHLPVQGVFKKIAATAESWGFMVGNPSPDEKVETIKYSSDYRQALGQNLHERITRAQENALFKPWLDKSKKKNKG